MEFIISLTEVANEKIINLKEIWEHTLDALVVEIDLDKELVLGATIVG